MLRHALFCDYDCEARRAVLRISARLCGEEPPFPAYGSKKPSLFRRLFTLALPIIAQNFIVFGVGFADNLMVGQLGGDAINGLYFGNRVFFILQIFLFGLESSVVILSAQYWGQRNTRRIKEVVSITVRLGMAISGAFALAYETQAERVHHIAEFISFVFYPLHYYRFLTFNREIGYSFKHCGQFCHNLC